MWSFVLLHIPNFEVSLRDRPSIEAVRRAKGRLKEKEVQPAAHSSRTSPKGARHFSGCRVISARTVGKFHHFVGSARFKLQQSSHQMPRRGENESNGPHNYIIFPFVLSFALALALICFFYRFDKSSA